MTFRSAVAVGIEVATFGMTVYIIWLYMPETLKLEARQAVRAAGVPFEHASLRRRVRAEMMGDVIELATFGVPASWAAPA